MKTIITISLLFASNAFAGSFRVHYNVRSRRLSSPELQ